MKDPQHHKSGFSLVELLIVVAIIGILAAIAIPALLAARRASNESAAIGSLRSLASGEAAYLARYTAAGNMAAMAADKIIDSAWVNGVTRSNYKFNETNITGSSATWCFQATPATANDGTRAFNVSEANVMRYMNGTTILASGSGTPLGT